MHTSLGCVNNGCLQGKAPSDKSSCLPLLRVFSFCGWVAKRSILAFSGLRRKDPRVSSYLPSAPELPTGPVLGLQGRLMFQARSNYSSWFQLPGWQLTWLIGSAMLVYFSVAFAILLPLSLRLRAFLQPSSLGTFRLPLRKGPPRGKHWFLGLCSSVVCGVKEGCLFIS